ncbi:MAG: hypothetical protein ACI8YI_002706 [Paracoccaceae bacterium]|jgi:hypothetical protein
MIRHLKILPSPKFAVNSTKNLGLCGCLIILFAGAAASETTRIATYNVSLGRDGPGLLVRDLLSGKDPQIATVVDVIATVQPDILLLNDFDFDFDGIALGAFADLLAAKGAVYPHRFAARPNSGLASGLDLDGDRWFGGAGDNQGFGQFSGAQGMAILSKFAIEKGAAQDFSDRLWKDLPGAMLPIVDGVPWPSQGAWDVQRLSSKGHWDVPVILPDGRVLHVLASHPTPPVFDGPENQNGLRNRDEIRFWSQYISKIAPGALFAVMGDLNADPNDGEGSQAAIRALLAHPAIQDVTAASLGAVAASARQAGPNLAQVSNPSFDTVDWDESRTPGNMRVDYVLPSSSLNVSGAGVFWPAPDETGFNLVGLDGGVGSHHRLVWVDIE